MEQREHAPILSTAAAGGSAAPAPAGLLRSRGVEPAARLLLWAARTGIERLGTWLLAPFSSVEARARRLGAWRRRAARRAVHTLGRLRGVWVKAGQFAAHRHDLVPAETAAALAELRDRVPPLPFPRIAAAVESELGAPLEALFAEFEPEPLGAASIAQVHRARLPSGAPVAVKVQYPGLEAGLSADLALVRAAFRVLSLLPGHRGVDPARLLAEFEAGLRAELDFEHEAAVAAEIAANLAGDARVVVPRIVTSHSTRRVLTMEYHRAVPITDRAALARLGVRPADVLELVARAYAKQVFDDGLFHADPHPGNLFVLDEPDAARRPRVLFVDFGLSKRLDPELRREIRRGAYALVGRDLDAFLAAMQRLDMIAPGAEPAVREAVAAMFARIAQQGGALAVPGAAVLSLKDEAKELLRATPGLQLPHDLLLFAKTLSYVFALGEQLDPEADLMKVTLPYLLKFLAERDRGAPDAAPTSSGAPPGGAPGAG